MEICSKEKFMLNYLWGAMILIGLSVGVVSGQVEAVSNAAIDSAGEAVTLAITMLGIMSLWTGLMEVAKRCGIMDSMTKGMAPVLRYLFPRIPKNHKVNEYITANMVANILGLGWAATPMGLKAMKELAALERERLAKKKGTSGKNALSRNTDREKEELSLTKASDEMCTFLVINISSLQLIPVSVIAYRAQYGSVNPAAVVFPGLVATLVNTVVAVIFCRLMCRKGEKETKSEN